VRLAYTRIVFGSRNGAAACIAMESPSGFLGQGCPN
jgi:hypothetical protein